MIDLNTNRILDTVKQPSDLKKLTVGQLSVLADEARAEIISLVATCRATR